MSTNVKATIEDLYQVPGKAEIVDGEIVHMSPTGAAQTMRPAKSSLVCAHTVVKRRSVLPLMTMPLSRLICQTADHSVRT